MKVRRGGVAKLERALGGGVHESAPRSIGLIGGVLGRELPETDLGRSVKASRRDASARTEIPD